MQKRKSCIGKGVLVLATVISTLVMAKDAPLKGFIDSFGYGYKVKISINGTLLKVIKGGGQQATRLFAVDHPMKAQASPEQADIFCLKEGENTISIEFEKDPDTPHALEIKLEVPDRYTVPLLHLKSSTKKSAKIEKKFMLDKKMPAKFKTLELNDSGI